MLLWHVLQLRLGRAQPSWCHLVTCPRISALLRLRQLAGERRRLARWVEGPRVCPTHLLATSERVESWAIDAAVDVVLQTLPQATSFAQAHPSTVWRVAMEPAQQAPQAQVSALSPERACVVLRIHPRRLAQEQATALSRREAQRPAVAAA